MEYGLFLRLELHHDYFGDAPLPIQTRPDAATATMLGNAGLVFRRQNGRADR